MKNTLKKLLHSKILYGVIAIILGGLFFVPGNLALKITITIIGGLIILFGIYLLCIALFSKANDHQDNKNLLLPSIFIIISGILFTVIIWYLLNIILLIAGIILIGYGIYGFILNVKFDTTFLKGKIVSITSDIILIVLGIFLCINMNNSFTWASYINGSLLILIGLFYIVNEFIRLKNENTIKKNANNNASPIVDGDVIEVECHEKNS